MHNKIKRGVNFEKEVKIKREIKRKRKRTRKRTRKAKKKKKKKNQQKKKNKEISFTWLQACLLGDVGVIWYNSLGDSHFQTYVIDNV